MLWLKVERQRFLDSFLVGFPHGFLYCYALRMLAKLVLVQSLIEYVNMTTCCFRYNVTTGGVAETVTVVVGMALLMACMLLKLDWRFPYDDMPLAVQGGIYGGMLAIFVADQTILLLALQAKS